MATRAFPKVSAFFAGAVVLACLTSHAAPNAADWQEAEIVRFTDFDDLEVTLDGKPHKAFLVGLTPLREIHQDKNKREDARVAVEAQMKKCRLVAKVVTTDGEVVGLSIDTGPGRAPAFDHFWDPNEYPYCWSGWGMFNFNAYFLWNGTTTFKDNFGENDGWREAFARVRREIEQKPQRKTEPGVGADSR
jgi:hypothetical protein